MYTFNDSDVKRFWSHVEKTEYCWLWTSQLREGYGLFMLKRSLGNKSPVAAHRLSYMLNTGEYPGTLHVRHKCHNPPCVNPEHLQLGTHIDNMRDMQEKNALAKVPVIKKPRFSGRKLSQQQFDEIVEALKNPYWGQVNELARKYGVTHSQISHIKNGRVYRNDQP